MEELNKSLLLVDSLEFSGVDGALRMVAALHHQRSLIFDPVIEQVQSKWPDGFEREVFQLLSDAVWDFYKLNVHLVKHNLVRAKNIAEQSDWEEVFDGFVCLSLEGLACLDGPPQHFGIVDNSFVKDYWLS